MSCFGEAKHRHSRMSLALHPGYGPHSAFNADAFAENAVRSHPTVDQPAIITDLVTVTLDSLHDVQIFIAANTAKYDIADFKQSGIDRCNGAELPGFNSPFHRLTARTE